MLKKEGPETTTVEGKEKKLGYENEFRALLKENPGILKVAIKLIDQALEEYNPPEKIVDNEYSEKVKLMYDKEANKWLQGLKDYHLRYPMRIGRGTLLVPGESVKDEESGLTVTVLGRSNRKFPKREDIGDYLKITFQGQSFFVKRSYITISPGFREFQDTLTAKEALKELEYVKVIEAKLGYQDDKESWFVSRFEDLETAGYKPGVLENNIFSSREHDDYGNPIIDTSKAYIESKLSRSDLLSRLDEITRIMKELGLNRDLAANLFYNRSDGTFILLDVTSYDGNQPHFRKKV